MTYPPLPDWPVPACDLLSLAVAGIHALTSYTGVKPAFINSFEIGATYSDQVHDRLGKLLAVSNVESVLFACANAPEQAQQSAMAAASGA